MTNDQTPSFQGFCDEQTNTLMSKRSSSSIIIVRENKEVSPRGSPEVSRDMGEVGHNEPGELPH